MPGRGIDLPLLQGVAGNCCSLFPVNYQCQVGAISYPKYPSRNSQSWIMNYWINQCQSHSYIDEKRKKTPIFFFQKSRAFTISRSHEKHYLFRYSIDWWSYLLLNILSFVLWTNINECHACLTLDHPWWSLQGTVTGIHLSQFLSLGLILS